MRSSAVFGAVVIAAASWLATAPAAWAATGTPEPSSTSQATPTPPATATPTDTGTESAAPALTFDPTSAAPGKTVSVSISGWRFSDCQLEIDGIPASTPCVATSSGASGSVTVPSSATPGPIPVVACPNRCAERKAGETVSRTLQVVQPGPASQPVGTVGGSTTGQGPSRQAPAITATSSSHPTGLVAGIVLIAVIGAVLGRWLLRRNPPAVAAIPADPAVQVVPHADAGVVTVERPPVHLHVTASIRLRRDDGHCQLEAIPL